MALMAAGALMVAATLLHPSRETATTIIASESRLVAAHVAYTVAWLLVLLGLPGLYAAQRGGMGHLGLAGFLTAFTGTYLIAVTGNFGFLAPVVAKQSPAVLDSISQYSPVVIINGLAAILFMIGYILFGIAMIRTAALPRWSGVLVAVGAPAHFDRFRCISARLDRRLADRDSRQRVSRCRARQGGLSALAHTGRIGHAPFR